MKTPNKDDNNAKLWKRVHSSLVAYIQQGDGDPKYPELPPAEVEAELDNWLNEHAANLNPASRPPSHLRRCLYQRASRAAAWVEAQYDSGQPYESTPYQQKVHELLVSSKPGAFLDE
jgi:hypothetical protein